MDPLSLTFETGAPAPPPSTCTTMECANAYCAKYAGKNSYCDPSKNGTCHGANPLKCGSVVWTCADECVGPSFGAVGPNAYATQAGCTKACGLGPPPATPPGEPINPADCGKVCGQPSYCNNGTCHGALCGGLKCGWYECDANCCVIKSEGNMPATGAWKTLKECQAAGCKNDPATCGGTSGGGTVYDPGCVKACGTGSYCVKTSGTCHGCTTACGKFDCVKDQGCVFSNDPNTAQFDSLAACKAACKYGPPGTIPLPALAEPTPAPLDIAKIKELYPPAKAKAYTAARQSKPPLKAGRAARLTLWHEGVNKSIQANPAACKTYFHDMVAWSVQKQFDRVFMLIQDPGAKDKYGNTTFAYSQVDFVVNNYLKVFNDLGADPGVEIGLLLVVDPKDPWTYAPGLPGGIAGNNPGYTNTIPNTPDGGVYRMPYRYCGDNKTNMCYTAPKAPPNPKVTGTCPAFQPKSGLGQGSANFNATEPNNACGVIGGICTSPNAPCCIQFNVGAPNNLEQAFKFVGEVNAAAAKAGLGRKVTTIAFDGEDLGEYGTDPFGMAQAWQAALKYAPDVLEIGTAKQGSLTPSALGSNASYPEFYWINELKICPPATDNTSTKVPSNKPAVPKVNPACATPYCATCDPATTCSACAAPYEYVASEKACLVCHSGCGNCTDPSVATSPCNMCKNEFTMNYDTCIKSGFSPSECQNCQNCRQKIYQQFRNDPAGFLAAFDPFLRGQGIEHMCLPPNHGVCPLLSIERAHAIAGYNDCVQKRTNTDNGLPGVGFCGTFDGFGSWDWDKFEALINLMATTYGIKDFGVYEWQFVPPQWREIAPTSFTCGPADDPGYCGSGYCDTSSGKCVCPAGYSGDTCNIAPNGVTKKCPAPCGAHAYCDDGTGTCKCLPGFKMEGGKCVAGSGPTPPATCDPPCGANAACVDGACVCNPNYTLVGDTCVANGTVGPITCPPGYTYNAAHKMCMVNGTFVPPTPPPPPTCSPACGANATCIDGKCVCKPNHVPVGALGDAGRSLGVGTDFTCVPVLEPSKTCPGGQVIVNGVCVTAGTLTPNVPCPPGFSRVGSFCVEDATLACPPGYVSQGGECYPVLSPGVTCPPNNVIVDGRCVACPAGYVMEGGKCVCPPGYTDINGTCVETGTLVCPPGYTNVGGTCAESAKLVCPPGYTNVGGTCAEAGTLVCPAGYTNINGTCVESAKLVCPPGYTDMNGTCVEQTTLVCPPGYTSIGGKCLPVLTPNATCPPSFVLKSGACVCPPGTEQVKTAGGTNGATTCVATGTVCASGQTLLDGVCVTRGTLTCPTGYVSRRGECYPILTPTATCPPGTVLTAAPTLPSTSELGVTEGLRCVPILHPNTTCSPPSVFDGDKCVCPSGTTLVGGTCFANGTLSPNAVAPTHPSTSSSDVAKRRTIIIGSSVGAAVVIGLVITAVVMALKSHAATASTTRVPPSQ